jgi:hypothetical protein
MSINLRLKARIEAARRAAPIAPVSDEEFRNDVIEARKEYRAHQRPHEKAT